MSWGAIAIASIAVSAVSTGMTMYGSYAQGKAQQKMNQYNADVAIRQAEIDKRNAETNITMVQDTAKSQAKLQRRNVAVIEGEQKGILAAQGVGGGSVTAADIMKTTLDTAELDRQAIRYNADSKAYAIKTGSDFNTWNLDQQSRGYNMAGKNAMRAGKINTVSSLLSGASQIASTGMTYGLLTK